jgi:ATP-binding cassette, subfamily B, bacterial PglK
LDQPLSEKYSNFSTVDRLHLEHSIALRNVSFCYQSDSPEAIRKLSLLIPHGSRVGFIGETGSGKSTVMDLIMGLLKPTSGVIEIDGQPLGAGN